MPDLVGNLLQIFPFWTRIVEIVGFEYGKLLVRDQRSHADLSLIGAVVGVTTAAVVVVVAVVVAHEALFEGLIGAVVVLVFALVDVVDANFRMSEKFNDICKRLTAFVFARHFLLRENKRKD